MGRSVPGRRGGERKASSVATILIVDDERIGRRLVEVTLRRQGHEIHVARHGAEALGRLAEGGIDLVIADLSMPVMDGLELLRAIRADERSATLPVIMLSGSHETVDRQAAQEAGVNAFLVKPSELQSLVETVTQQLDRAGVPPVTTRP